MGIADDGKITELYHNNLDDGFHSGQWGGKCTLNPVQDQLCAE